MRFGENRMKPKVSFTSDDGEKTGKKKYKKQESVGRGGKSNHNLWDLLLNYLFCWGGTAEAWMKLKASSGLFFFSSSLESVWKVLLHVDPFHFLSQSWGKSNKMQTQFISIHECLFFRWWSKAWEHKTLIMRLDDQRRKRWWMKAINGSCIHLVWWRLKVKFF